MVLTEVAPDGYAAVAGLQKYVSAHLDRAVLHLVTLRASILNGCGFCVDMHSQEALADGEDARRLFAVAAWRETPFFDPRERAALALTDALTRLGDEGVPDDVWDDAVTHWGERDVAMLVLAIGTINVWNRIVAATRNQPSLR
jgi:AhpD family alkylhydroperoxidase